ncbi:MAG: LacI family transcriptional regulator [Chloroflexi bacterium]|nr:LacI family transcriptional regulator [Chloroflexota bacterium]
MPVTLKDIAKKIGYSITTVSRALAEYDDVAESTRQLVRKTANEMGYHPDITARRLRKQCTDTIGIIVPTYKSRFSDPFFGEFLAGVGNKSVEYEFDLLVSTRAPDDGELAAYERMVMERRVDGLLIITTRPQDKRIIYLIEQNFPFVAFGSSDLGVDFPCLDVDGEGGMHRLTQHLIDLGHQRIAYISAPFDVMYAHQRIKGYKNALAANAIPFDETLVTVGDLTEHSGQALTYDFLTRDQKERPTAIMVCNDWMASGAINAARELGMTVGRDVAITGFDDVSLARHTLPQLTTVHQPAYEAGWLVCEMLIHLLQEKPLAEQCVILEPDLVVRESCGAVIKS